MIKKLLVLMMAVVAFSSCEGPTGPAGPPGLDGSGIVESIRIIVEENDWVLYEDQDGLNPFYMVEVTIPELTNKVYTNGSVQAYMILNPGMDNETQRPLNYSYPNENNWQEYWSEYYTYDFMPRSVAFYVHYSDFQVDIVPPQQEFRLVLTW